MIDGKMRDVIKEPEESLLYWSNMCMGVGNRGSQPEKMTSEMISYMAGQAMANGMDRKETIDTLFQVFNQSDSDDEEPVAKYQYSAMALTPEQAEYVKSQLKMWQSFLLYWDMILCTEIQNYAHKVLSLLRSKGLYRHELKRYANTLENECRRLQMRVKDNDRILVHKWSGRIDPNLLYGKDYRTDGGSVATRLVLAYHREFGRLWKVVELDCREVAKSMACKHVDIVAELYKVDALTNTGIELYDECVRKMKSLVSGHGKSSITKSTHHESMRCACLNLLRYMGADGEKVGSTELEYAKKHLADMQIKMTADETMDSFQGAFDKVSEEFADYIMARMRVEMQEGKVSFAAKRMVFSRLGERRKVKKFFTQLGEVEDIDDGQDIFETAASVAASREHKSALNRFWQMCIDGKCYIDPEPEEKQEQRMLRVLARRNGYMLPDDILRVMVMKHGTKAAVLRILAGAGFELDSTVRRIRKMKAAELKRI